MNHLLIRGDARRIPLADKSVHMCCTSPPYFGLRDYQTARWEGGDPACSHETNGWHGPKQTGQAQNGHASRADRLGRTECSLCGARRVDRQIGLEESPGDYVATMVSVFREVWRVLRDDGTVWLNLGDSFAGYHGNKNHEIPTSSTNGWVNGYNENLRGDRRPQSMGLKPKDLVGIPWRVALALQADGWYLRSDIIWSKPNPMPESVTDRPTKAHEYLFLMAKGETYFYDADAIREPHDTAYRKDKWEATAARVSTKTLDSGGRNGTGHSSLGNLSNPAGRNRRSVWTVPTTPFPGAHFATFPPRLIEPCIKAGTSERGVCPDCGSPWERVVEKGEPVLSSWSANGAGHYDPSVGGIRQRSRGDACTLKHIPVSRTIGWQPACPCNAGDPVPAVVFDPFAGASTTLVVANALGRHGIGCDLNPDYLRMGQRRLLRPHAPVERASAGEALPLFDALAEATL